MSVGAGIAASGAVSALGSLIGSSETASAQKQASNMQGQMYQATVQQENPYINAGYTTIDPQSALAGNAATAQGTSPYLSAATAAMPASAGAMTQAELEKTPGYQFTLGQGLKMTQANAAAKGLGVSGAALKGAATYATGLADQTYQNRFNEAQTTFNDWLNQNTAYQGNLLNEANMLNQVSTLGQNAASQTGTQGTSLANAAGNYLSQSGQSTGAGTVSAANALSNAANQYTGYNYWAGQSGGTGGYSGAQQMTGYAPSISPGTSNYLGTGFSTPP